MSTNTPNIGLVKPQDTDIIDYQTIFNANADKIDEQIGSLLSSQSGYTYQSISAWLNEHESRQWDYAISVKGRKFGAIGDGLSHPLSEKYTTLAEAQLKYPHATALTDEIDWCAIQLAVNDHKHVFLPNGNYYVNKPIDTPSARTIKGANRNDVTITQTQDNVEVIKLQYVFNHVSDITVTYLNQQLRTSLNSLGFSFYSVSQSSFQNISVLKSNGGFDSPTTKAWNNVFSNIFIENFSNIGFKLQGGTGVVIQNLFITSPYLTAKSGIEIEDITGGVINQLNVEYGNYESPVLISGSTITVNGMHFEQVTLKADNGYITTFNGKGTASSQVDLNSIYFYNNRLNSTDGITRGAIIYTKQRANITVNGLLLSAFYSDLDTKTACDVPNSLFITDVAESRVEFKGVYGGTIVGTNEYNGSYNPALSATNYTFVTNNDSNLGVSLQRVNTTVYMQKFKNEIIAPKLTVTNGQIIFPSTEVPSTDANTLDDYREATFQGGIVFGGLNTGITYTTNEGHYTKIGRIVYFTLRLVLSSKGTATGTALMNLLPFFSAKKYSLNVTFINGSGIDGHIQATTREAGSKIVDLGIVTPTGVVVLNDTHFTNTTEIILSGMYQI